AGIQDGVAEVQFRAAYIIDTAAINSGRISADCAVGDHHISVLIGGAVEDGSAVTGDRVAAKSAVAYCHRRDGKGPAPDVPKLAPPLLVAELLLMVLLVTVRNAPPSRAVSRMPTPWSAEFSMIV